MNAVNHNQQFQSFGKHAITYSNIERLASTLQLRWVWLKSLLSSVPRGATTNTKLLQSKRLQINLSRRCYFCVIFPCFLCKLKNTTIANQPQNKKVGEMTERHYFVQPVTHFPSDEILSVYIYKFTSIDEQNLAII